MDTVRLLASDSRIILSRNDWEPFEEVQIGQGTREGMQGSVGAVMNVMFRGTGIRVFGTPTPGGQMRFTMLDSSETKQTSSQDTVETSASVLLASFEGLVDGDHELEASMDSTFIVDAIEIDYVAENGFSPSRTGVNATEVDSQALFVNSGSTEISYLGGEWNTQTDDALYERDRWICREVGRCSWEYTFVGSSIWWFTSTTDDGGIVSILVDGVPEEGQVDLGGSSLHQRLVWSKTGLPLGRHTVKATLDSSSLPSSAISLDFLRISDNTQPEVSSSTISSTRSDTNTVPSAAPSSSPTNKPEEIPGSVIAGAVIGVTACLLLILIFGLLWRRRRRRDKEAAQLRIQGDPWRLEAYPPTYQLGGGMQPHGKSYSSEKTQTSEFALTRSMPTASGAGIPSPQQRAGVLPTQPSTLPGTALQIEIQPRMTDTPPPQYYNI